MDCACKEYCADVPCGEDNENACCKGLSARPEPPYWAEPERAMRPPPPPAPPPSKTYIVSAPSLGMVKIGKSQHPGQRLSSLQSGSPVPLLLERIFPVNIEGDLHKRFADYRSHGEWFRREGDLLDFIEQTSWCGP